MITKYWSSLSRLFKIHQKAYQPKHIIKSTKHDRLHSNRLDIVKSNGHSDFRTKVKCMVLIIKQNFETKNAFIVNNNKKSLFLLGTSQGTRPVQITGKNPTNKQF